MSADVLRRNQVVSQIPTDAFIQRFGVTHPTVVQTLRANPSLCYLLGAVTKEPKTRDVKFDGVERDVYYLVGGSGMFDLRNPDDAERWRGIFNHSIGTPRQVQCLSQKLKSLTREERGQFEKLGYDFSELDRMDPALLRDVMIPSHNSRRAFDERQWYGLDDEVHQEGSPGELTHAYFDRCGAPPIFADLVGRVEEHTQHLPAAGENYFPNILDALLTYADWTFLQKPETLKVSFDQKRRSRPDLDPNILDLLEACGQAFELAANNILQTNILDDLKKAPPYTWEIQVRRAYCASSGISLEEAFPLYVDQYPQVLN